MQTLYIHPENPQPRLIQQVVTALKQDQLIIYPTDTSYAFGCQIGSKLALQKLKHIRQLDDKHQFTLLCRDLSEIATYASIDNQQFKILKANTPAAITYILNATKDVPKKLAHAKKHSIGIHVPANPIAQAILAELNEPMLTSSIHLPNTELQTDDPFIIEQALSNQVDLMIDAGLLTTEQTTIIDMTNNSPMVIREGAVDSSTLVF